MLFQWQFHSKAPKKKLEILPRDAQPTLILFDSFDASKYPGNV
jgi:hypothetical protein